MNSSGEETILKTRKPYTITKQRERWTDEEHNRFLEALKLYGRAWQRIEEHIGTKTAVQIRSHAQKFFTKLEKEALMKGVPLEQAHDIEIPPPRPKRKPCSPYPRKTGVGSLCRSGEVMDEKPSKSASSLSTSKNVLDTESSEPQEIPAAAETLQRRKEVSEDGSCSEVLNLFQNAPSASISSANKTSSNPGTYREVVPVMRKIKEKTALDESCVSVEVNEELKENGTSYADQDTERLPGINSQTKSAQVERKDVSKQSEKQYPSLNGNQQGDISFRTTVTDQVGAHANANPFINPTVSATQELPSYSEMSSIHQSFPAFPPFTSFHSNHDAYRFHNISSILSNLIVTTLVQNPVVHAAASMAASFWPSADVDTSIDSTSKIPVGEIPVRHMNPSPSLAAIAAATVAAASAWWATQGLLPLFPPLHPGFAFSPAPTTTIPVMDMARASEDNKDGVDCTFQNPALEGSQFASPDQSEALRAGRPSSKSLVSSESDESERGAISHFTELKAYKINKFKSSIDTGFHNSDMARSKKPDPSSCGSNTPYSSEVETDTVLEKHEEARYDAKQVPFHNPPAGDASSRRLRSSGCTNESWKEVSEEGRLAFQALFNREILPQSFSLSHTEDSMGLGTENMRGDDDTGNGYLMSETGHGKLKANRTGFKPYKRCSVEAKENRVAAGEETRSKRMRLEGETST